MKFIHVLIIVFLHLSCTSMDSENKDRKSSGNFDLHGHRGARGLRPENTIPAFQEAIRLGMNTLELDTVLTKEKNLIIHHDTHTNPVLCMGRDNKAVPYLPIDSLTVADLKTYDCGKLKNPKFERQIPVPDTQLITLTELFQYIKAQESKEPGLKGLRFNIETKFPEKFSPELVHEFARIIVIQISGAGMENRSIVQSFHTPILPIIKKLNPKIQTSALYAPTIFQGIQLKLGIRSVIQNEILEDANKMGAEIISPYFLYVDQSFIKKAQNLNLKVIPWTVNEKTEMLRLMGLGVDGLISDYPDLLIESQKEFFHQK